MASPPRLRIEALPITHPVAALLVAQVQQEYVARYGGPDETPLDVDEFAGERGEFLVGWVDGAPVAIGAWRWHAVVAGVEPGLEQQMCTEIKRMYVAPAHRGRGLARQMLRELEQRAARAGSATMILETGTRQPEAIALYESAGYRPIPGFGHYRDAPLSRCFAKRLPPWEGHPLLRDALAVHLEPVLEALDVGFSFNSSAIEEDPAALAGVPTDVVLYEAVPARWAARFPADRIDASQYCLDLWMWFPREAGPPIRVQWETFELPDWLAAERPDLAARLARATGDPEQDVAVVAESLDGWFTSRTDR